MENELRYNREKERKCNFRESGIWKTPGDKFNAKNGTGEQFVERVLGSITREIAGIEARAKGEPRKNKRDTISDNREDKRIEDKHRKTIIDYLMYINLAITPILFSIIIYIQFFKK